MLATTTVATNKHTLIAEEQKNKTTAEQHRKMHKVKQIE